MKFEDIGNFFFRENALLIMFIYLSISRKITFKKFRENTSFSFDFVTSLVKVDLTEILLIFPYFVKSSLEMRYFHEIFVKNCDSLGLFPHHES